MNITSATKGPSFLPVSDATPPQGKNVSSGNFEGVTILQPPPQQDQSHRVVVDDIKIKSQEVRVKLDAAIKEASDLRATATGHEQRWAKISLWDRKGRASLGATVDTARGAALGAEARVEQIKAQVAALSREEAVAARLSPQEYQQRTVKINDFTTALNGKRAELREANQYLAKIPIWNLRERKMAASQVSRALLFIHGFERRLVELKEANPQQTSGTTTNTLRPTRSSSPPLTTAPLYPKTPSVVEKSVILSQTSSVQEKPVTLSSQEENFLTKNIPPSHRDAIRGQMTAAKQARSEATALEKPWMALPFWKRSSSDEAKAVDAARVKALRLENGLSKVIADAQKSKDVPVAVSVITSTNTGSSEVHLIV